MGKYLLYAFGEIMLVMIGILLALQVNNWNEERNFYEQTEKQLIALKEVVLDERLALDQVLNVEIFRYHSMQKYLEFADLEPFSVTEISMPTISDLNYQPTWIWNKPLPESFDDNFMHLTLAWSSRYMRFYADRTSIDELNRNGVLSFINNKELSNSIKTYYRRSNFFFPETKDNIYLLNWEELIAQKGFVTINPESIKDPIRMLQEDIELSATLRRMAAESLFNGYAAIQMIDHSEALLLEIDKQLGL